jgi:hypothetical protein
VIQISKHPLIILGAGLAVGYFVYRNRDAILERARMAAEQTDEIMRGPRARLDSLDGGGASESCHTPNA